MFKFLKEENSSNYTVRRQEFQISRVMEKSRIVREVSVTPTIRSVTGSWLHSLSFEPENRGATGDRVIRGHWRMGG